MARKWKGPKFKQQFYVGEIIRDTTSIVKNRFWEVMSVEGIVNKIYPNHSSWCYLLSTENISTDVIMDGNGDSHIQYKTTQIWLEEGEGANWELFQPVEERLWNL